MALYSGRGTGAIAIDGAAATPAIGAGFRLSGVDALAFLTDALGFKRIEGTGKLRLRPPGRAATARRRSPGRSPATAHGGEERRDPRRQHPEDAAVALGADAHGLAAIERQDRVQRRRRDLHHRQGHRHQQRPDGGRTRVPARRRRHHRPPRADHQLPAQRQGRRQERQAPGFRRAGADLGAARQAEDLPRRPGHLSRIRKAHSSRSRPSAATFSASAATRTRAAAAVAAARRRRRPASPTTAARAARRRTRRRTTTTPRPTSRI